MTGECKVRWWGRNRLAQVCLAWAAAVAPLTAQGVEDRVLVQYDATLSDSVLAVLSRAIAAEVDVLNWPEITVERGDGLESIVDRYYDIYARDSGSTEFARPRPRTAATVVELIEAANDIGDGLTAGTRIRIPPLPATSQGGDPGDAVRVFDPWRQAYLRRDGSSMPAIGEEVVVAAGENPWRRPARSLVTLPVAAAERLRANAVGLDVYSTGTVTVELLDTATCVPAKNVVEASPYMASARQRVEMDFPKVADVLARSPDLYVLDFDFNDGHGRRVLDAALWVLRALGVPDAAEVKLKGVELSPAELGGMEQRWPMAWLMTKYSEDVSSPAVRPTDLDAALGWMVRTRTTSANQAVRELHPLLVQAHLHNILEAGGWFNASWRFQNAGSIRPEQFDAALRRGSFGAVAAGNDEGKEVIAGLEPQATAIAYPEFVTVTYGAPSGIIYGNTTRSGGVGGVELNAVGCGFEFTERRGSSYASAIVAAAAWVKHILDDISSADMRAELVRSSLLSPSGTAVDSGGFFDPARLISGWRAHVLDGNRRTMTEVANVTLDANCDTYSGRRDVVVYEEGGEYYMVVRRDDPAQPRLVRVEKRCKVNELRLEYGAGDRTVVVEGPKEFVENIGHLTF